MHPVGTDEFSIGALQPCHNIRGRTCSVRGNILQIFSQARKIQYSGNKEKFREVELGPTRRPPGVLQDPVTSSVHASCGEPLRGKLKSQTKPFCVLAVANLTDLPSCVFSGSICRELR